MFLRLSVAWKVLVAFVVMTQCFDLVPQVMYGSTVWDAGAIMLLVAAVQLMFAKPKEPKVRAISARLLWIFIFWMGICLVYSLVVYGYPTMNTIKTSRQMILGYLSIFIFLRLFRVDKHALSMLLKWLYIITYVLLIVVLVQHFINFQLLQGLSADYNGTVRYLPIFLPVSLFFLWTILSRFFQGEGLKFHEWVYGGMTVIVVALTYTRGIYLAVLIALSMMFFLLQLRQRLKLTSVVFFFAIASLGIAVLIAAGGGDRILGRAMSGFDIVLDSHDAGSKGDADTFTGRLMLVKERIALVSEHNPVLGFGFLHEGDVSQDLRKEIKIGGAINTPEMQKKYAQGYHYVWALYSADIGWGNIVVNTGFVGLFLFLLFVATFLLSYKKIKMDMPPFSHYRLAFFLQTLVLLLTMFTGSTFTTNVQIPAFMIAGYLYSSAKRHNELNQLADFGLSKGQEDHDA